MGLHVRLKLLGRCETLSTVLMLTRMRLAVDHPHVPLHQPLVRTRVVTVLVMVTFVGLHFGTLPNVISEVLLKKIAITTWTVANSVAHSGLKRGVRVVPINFGLGWIENGWKWLVTHSIARIRGVCQKKNGKN